MTITDEQFVSENSENQPNQSNSLVQNACSDKTSFNSNLIETSEPETKTDKAVKKAEEAQSFEVELPEKFKNKDGSPNVSALVKSYKALEPLLNERANWIKEKETLQKEKDLLTQKISKFDLKSAPQNLKYKILPVKLYETFIEKASDKEKAQELIKKLNDEYSDETANELEKLFPSEVIKNVSVKSEYAKNLLIQGEREKLKEQEFEKAENYLKEVVEKNFDALKNPAVAGIFNEAFKTFGSNLDSEWFFNSLSALKDSFIKDYQKEQILMKEKESAVATASKISPSSSSKGGTSLLGRNALDLTPQEIGRMLDEYYSK